MTNLRQNSTSNRLPISPEQALVLLPAVGGALLSLVIGIAGFYPLFTKTQEQSKRLETYRQQEQDLPLIRSQLNKLSEREELVLQQETQLVDLVSSVEQLDTILSALNRLSTRNRVVMVSVEPEQPTADDGGKAPKKSSGEKKKKDAASILDNSRFSPKGYLLVFEGDFRGILGFLRDVEQLDVAILLSDLDLSASSAEKAAGSGGVQAQPSSNRLTLKLRLTALAKVKPSSSDPNTEDEPKVDPVLEPTN